MTSLKTAARRLITSSCLRDPSIRYMKVARPRLWAFVLAYSRLPLLSVWLFQITPLCTVTGILLINRIRNLSSTDKELEIRSLETGIHGSRGNKYYHL